MALLVVAVSVFADNAPAKVQTALKKMYPKADGIAWSQDGGYYCADFMMNGYEKNVWFNAQGQWQMTQTEGDHLCKRMNCLTGPIPSCWMAAWAVSNAAANSGCTARGQSP